MKTSSNLKDIFDQIEDHRSHINQLHNLVDILLIGIISVICGAETWDQMNRFAKSIESFQLLIVSNLSLVLSSGSTPFQI